MKEQNCLDEALYNVHNSNFVLHVSGQKSGTRSTKAPKRRSDSPRMMTENSGQ